MLLPHSHAWTPFQKWLIVGTAIMLIVFAAAGIYYYERHSRTTDSVLVGTWRFPPLMGDDVYFRLDADHTFRVQSELAEKDSTFRGLWFGGGDFVYFRQPTFDEDGFVTDHPLLIWRLERISPNELHVRLNPGGVPRTVRRVSPESP
jgi:hypothetical protein